ncbi:MAG: hypothetical protein P8X89_03170 [Reinekea sp.]
MGVPAIFLKQIEIKLLHPASTWKSRIPVLDFSNIRFILFLKTVNQHNRTGQPQ